jgi:hypothetical protein
VNYGIPADYEQLERLGISVKGAIVIARYGASWRGIKPKVAAEHGAVGCLIYSDPREDGYFQGDVFPAGPWRPRDGAQRGSVMDMPIHPGDPLTPESAQLPPRDVCLLKSSDPHQNSRAADFLWRRAATPSGSQRARCAGGLARGAADYIPRWSGPRQSAPEGEVELGYQAVVQRDCPDTRPNGTGYLDRSWESS